VHFIDTVVLICLYLRRVKMEILWLS